MTAVFQMVRTVSVTVTVNIGTGHGQVRCPMNVSKSRSHEFKLKEDNGAADPKNEASDMLLRVNIVTAMVIAMDWPGQVQPIPLSNTNAV